MNEAQKAASQIIEDGIVDISLAASIIQQAIDSMTATKDKRIIELEMMLKSIFNPIVVNYLNIVNKNNGVHFSHEQNYAVNRSCELIEQFIKEAKSADLSSTYLGDAISLALFAKTVVPDLLRLLEDVQYRQRPPR